MKTTSREHGSNMFCACSFHGNSMYNLLSYCGLIDTKIRASDKDLPVPIGQFVGVPVYTLFRSIFILIDGMH